MIRMTIQIAETSSGRANEFGAGVLVLTEPFRAEQVAQSEGVTWAGLCTAINEYMRSRGVVEFDCLKPVRQQ